MQIFIYPKSFMCKYFSGKKQLEIEAAEGATAAQVLKQSGLDWEKCPSFGFISINGQRSTIHHPLSDGDVLKVFPMIAGG